MPASETQTDGPIGQSPRRRRKAAGLADLGTSEHAPALQAPSVEMHLGIAPMRRRLAARVIDLLCVATWMFALSIAHLFLHLQLWSDTITPEPWGSWFLATVTFFVMYAVYEIAFIARLGATPGKDLMRIKVVDDTTGDRPSVGQAARRWLLPGIVQPIPGVWIGGLLTLGWGASALVDSERRAVHDRLANTRVVEKSPPRDEEEQAKRRREFTPSFVDPFAVFRAARSNPQGWRRHPSHDEV